VGGAAPRQQPQPQGKHRPVLQVQQQHLSSPWLSLLMINCWQRLLSDEQNNVPCHITSAAGSLLLTAVGFAVSNEQAGVQHARGAHVLHTYAAGHGLDVGGWPGQSVVTGSMRN